MRIPIPLVFALAVAVGAAVSILIQVNIKVLGSWDSRYAAFNGTHVYQTSPMIDTPYKTLYLGYGTAHFQNPISVFYLETVRSGSAGGTRDLGRYLPIRIIVESGSLPTNTYISWNDPLSGATRRLYFVADSHRGYVLGTYRTRAGATVNVAIPVYYVVDGSQVRLYPMERSAVDATQACNIVRNAGFGGAYNYVFAILDNQAYDCAFRSWSSTTVGWVQVASSVTSTALYPSPTYYAVTVTVGGTTLLIYLSYWYAVNADPGFFAVTPG
ncbi:MAG: hypothetical protein ACO2PN_16505 [Pyrobaculum sp.]|jgi:hypothetical protein